MFSQGPIIKFVACFPSVFWCRKGSLWQVRHLKISGFIFHWHCRENRSCDFKNSRLIKHYVLVFMPGHKMDVWLSVLFSCLISVAFVCSRIWPHIWLARPVPLIYELPKSQGYGHDFIARNFWTWRSNSKTAPAAPSFSTCFDRSETSFLFFILFCRLNNQKTKIIFRRWGMCNVFSLCCS